MKVEVWLKYTSQPIVYENVVNAYEKGSMYCVFAGAVVHKYPLVDIFRVVETYAGAQDK